MAKVTLNDITTGYQSATAYNANNDAIEAAIENTLSLDGTAPNAMGADLDINSYDINNADTIRTDVLYIAGTSVVSAEVLEVPNASVIPHTPSGGTPTDVAAHLDVIDANLAGAATMADLLTAPTTGAIMLLGFHTSGDGGGGAFYYDSTIPRTNHDGIITISPSRTVGTWTEAQQITWFASTVDATTGCWVRADWKPINVKWAGCKVDGIENDYYGIKACWDVARPQGIDIDLDEGTLLIVGEVNFPFRQTGTPTALLDCNNMTIFGHGYSSRLRTSSVGGADVLQLNGLKNISFKNFRVTSTISGSTSGSNGCSITAGWDNIDIDIRVENLASLDKNIYVDGGKALSLQSDGSTNETGTLRARIYAIGCVEGFGYEQDLVKGLVKDTSVVVDLVAEDCYTGVKFVAGAATSALSANMTQGLVVRAQTINCQHDVLLNRMHGGNIDVQVIGTKTAAAKRLDSAGAAWITSDTIVDAFQCTYAYNANIRVTGNKGDCDYKARIGGTTAGASGLAGATNYCNIELDIGGTAAISDLLAVDSGGNTLANSTLAVSKTTATSIPAEFEAATTFNNVRLGAVHSGIYVATLTGCTTAPTGIVRWTKEGGLVTMYIPSISGTSNSTLATLTGAPLSLAPATLTQAVAITTDNGLTTISSIVVDVDGLMTLTKGTTPSITFTASGNKGILGTTISYNRD